MAMHTPDPVALREAVAQRSEHALQCGALWPIETSRTLIEDGGIRFVVRQLSSLVRKATAARPTGDPFLPYEPDLFVADLSDTHIALLNKYNVIAQHLLIVTRRFEPQEALLDTADFAALLAALHAFDALGFYNGGEQAGASQAHKHLQAVPLPLDNDTPALPVEPLFAAARFANGIGIVPGLPFRHAYARIDLMAEGAAWQAVDCYRALLAAAGIAVCEAGGVTLQGAPYNLLVRRGWMLVVPRSTERIDGISVNALGFAGSFFVRDEAQRQALAQLGPMTALARVALP